MRRATWLTALFITAGCGWFLPDSAATSESEDSDLESVQFAPFGALDIQAEAMGAPAPEEDVPGAVRRPKPGQAPFVSVPIVADTPGVRTKVPPSFDERVEAAVRSGKSAELTPLEELQLVDYELTAADRANPEWALERIRREHEERRRRAEQNR